MGNGLGLFNSAASSSSVSAHSSATSAVTGGSGPLSLGAGIVAAGHANAPASGGYQSFQSGVQTNWNFVLSPYTMVLFIAQGAINATPYSLSGGDGDSTGASLGMQVIDNNGYISTVSRLSSAGGANFSERLYVSFANLSGSTVQGQFGAGTSAGGWSNVTPVPEPETWAMMLAGLGLVAGMARRKRKPA
jgi:hypothetical protein